MAVTAATLTRSRMSGGAVLGAIIGDIVGSPFEFDRGNKTTDFELFSEDSNYTDGHGDDPCSRSGTDGRGRGPDQSGRGTDRPNAGFRQEVPATPRARGGYGQRFARWLFADSPMPYGRYGNGSAKRVSSTG